MRFFRYLMRTTDVDRARAFYESILGDRSPPIALLPESAIARGARPHWLGIIGVKDLELRTEAFVARGAQPLGVPGHTGLSLLRDPGGALVALASSPEKWGVHRRSKSCGISSTQTTSLLQ